MANLSLRNLVKSYGSTEVLHSINLDIADGEFVVLVGPSGCGKSTTLRMIAGLEEITAGEVEIAGRIVNHLEPKDRDIAMVFQNYAIYPHMSVRKNIGFGLRRSKIPQADKDKRIDEVAEILSMSDYLDRKPGQLSGGQRQRVAIGRAMVRDPAVFLFDEPLSNLDAQLRTQMRLEIKKLHQRVGNTIVFVTHDQVEAMTMADRIVIMKDGYIQQVGTPQDVFLKPANIFVAQFIGAPSMNLLKGQVADGTIRIDGNAQFPVDFLNGTKLPESGEITIGIRPDFLSLSENGHLHGKVEVVEPLGAEALIYVNCDGIEMIAKSSGRNPPMIGQSVTLAADPENIHVFDTQTGNTLT